VALKLTVTTPEGLVHQGEVTSVVVPAHDGELGILPRHAPLIGQLGVGELRARPAAGAAQLHFFVAGGFLQILRDRVVVLATRAEPAKAIDRARAEEDVRALLAERLPPGTSIDARAERAQRLRAAQTRAKIAARRAG
jgi:F-type H+-transporting ATPase subunit epsilon